jgi:hypothetical protein
MKPKNKSIKLRNTQEENNSTDTNADLALIDKILKSSNSDPNFDWNKSAKYRTLTAKPNIDVKVIFKLISGLESMKKLPKSIVFYWYGRVLEMDISNQDRITALHGRLLYYHEEMPILTNPGWGLTSNNLTKKKYEEKLKLQKQLIHVNPDDYSNLLGIGHTYKKLLR